MLKLHTTILQPFYYNGWKRDLCLHKSPIHIFHATLSLRTEALETSLNMNHVIEDYMNQKLSKTHV